MKKRAAAAAAVVVAALMPAMAATAAGAQTTPRRVVYGVVNEHFDITLKNAKGRRIVRLAPGLVSFRIYDASNMHNFHLRGPGFNRATYIRGTGHVVWRVRLTAGKWKFRCDEHPLVMHGAFVVGTPATARASVR